MPARDMHGVRFPKRLVYGLAFFLAAGPTLAGTYAAATVGASTTVTANCTISTVAVQFGSYDPVGTNKATALTASGQVIVACVQGSAPTIAFGLGANPSGSTRRLKNTASADFLTYELYKPPTTTPSAACSYAAPTVWGTAGANLFTPTAPPSKATRTYNICGSVAAGQDPRIGTYSDTITATVNF
jgi:spore coat protein U-like protein